MRLAWVAFLGSVFLMVLGFATVLVFMIFIVVPTLELETVVRTECFVASISYYVTRNPNDVIDGDHLQSQANVKSLHDMEKRNSSSGCGAANEPCPPSGYHSDVSSHTNNTLMVSCAFVHVDFQSEGIKRRGALYDPQSYRYQPGTYSNCEYL